MRIEKKIGKYQENEANKNLRKMVPFIIAFVILFLTSLYYFPIYINLGIFEPTRNFLAGVLLTSGLFLYFQPYYYWKSGLRGEKRVVQNLSDKLGDEYSIFNDVFIKYGERGGNIDHIIIGPTGIFVIETKNSEGTITYDSYGWKGIYGNRNPSAQVTRNMFKVKDILQNCEVFKDMEPYVNQIVLFSNPKAKLNISREPDYGCKIIQIKCLADPSLADVIKNQAIRFSTQEVEKIEQCLETNILEL